MSSTPLRLSREPRAQAQRVLAQDLPLGVLRESGALHHLLDALRPRRVAMRPVAREEPEILSELLHAELERALPGVDGVEVAPLGQDLARPPTRAPRAAMPAHGFEKL